MFCTSRESKEGLGAIAPPFPTLYIYFGSVRLFCTKLYGLYVYMHLILAMQITYKNLIKFGTILQYYGTYIFVNLYVISYQ